MIPASADCELVTAYATRGSENAFRALVTRHVHLVYATALRQIGDAGLAEEITQNVFVALARKAPRLAGIETLAGWLHRTTLLEAKARLRAELRRGRREEIAAEAAALQREGTSPLDALVPLLDEGLLNLRDRDRLALVLRFLEERSLRDVGAVLGVDEDAARKRVSRALDRLAEFFRRRGFPVPAGAGCAALLANTAIAAPAALAASAANAGLAASGAATGFNLVLLKLMALTKTQTAVLCAIIAAAPLAWQWRGNARVTQQLDEVTAQIETATRNANELEQQLQRAQAALLRAQNDSSNSVVRLAALTAQRDGQAPRPVYRWDDDSPLVRVPRPFLDQLEVFAMANRRGQLSGEIKEVLQLTDSEAQQTQSAIDRFLSNYQAAQAQGMRRVEPTEDDLRGHKAEEARVFEVPTVKEQLREFRQALFAELEATLGVERFHLWKSALHGWMPVDDEREGSNSGAAVHSFGYRMRFYQPKPGERSLSWSLTSLDQRTGMGGPISLDEIPDIFRAHLQNWIALAQSQPPKESNAQK
jgi:RNA polymerase sigma factor (sigma-70 family)